MARLWPYWARLIGSTPPEGEGDSVRAAWTEPFSVAWGWLTTAVAGLKYEQGELGPPARPTDHDALSPLPHAPRPESPRSVDDGVPMAAAPYSGDMDRLGGLDAAVLAGADSFHFVDFGEGPRSSAVPFRLRATFPEPGVVDQPMQVMDQILWHADAADFGSAHDSGHGHGGGFSAIFKQLTLQWDERLGLVFEDVGTGSLDPTWIQELRLAGLDTDRAGVDNGAFFHF